MSKYQNKKKTKKGFTLVEVLVVVIFIGVLAAVAVPTYTRSVEKARATQGMDTLDQIAKAQYTYSKRHGKYANQFASLPLELTDKDGNPVKDTSEFEDKYFSYGLFASTYGRAARARREFNNKTYSLFVQYGTGKISCEPVDHEICKALGLPRLEKVDCYIGSSSNGGVVDYDANCFAKNGVSGVYCDKTGNYCAAFDKDGGILSGRWNFVDKTCNDNTSSIDIRNSTYLCKDGKICEEDKEHIGQCKPETPEEPEGVVTIECKKDMCIIYENGKEIGKCKAGDLKCFEKLEISGLVCDGGGKCFTYENGKIVDECKANKDNTACVKQTIDCSDGVCKIYEDGELVEECNKESPKCFAKLGITDAVICDPDSGKCFIFKGSQLVDECKANAEGTACEVVLEEPKITFDCISGTCTIYENGKPAGSCEFSDYACFEDFKINGVICEEKGVQCVIYKEGIAVGACQYGVDGCEKGLLDRDYPKNGTVCFEKEDNCYIFKFGKLVDLCGKNYIGNGCAIAGSELICYKDKGTCIEFGPKGDVIGDCAINAAGTGCAHGDAMSDGVLCEKDTCYVYEGGKVVDSCKANDAGTGCKEEEPECKPDDWACLCGGKVSCYEDSGATGLFCFPEDKVCRTFEKGKEVDKCEINDAGNGCKEETPSCKPGEWECIEKNGLSGTFCFKGICYIYEDGVKIGDCKANNDETGCEEKLKDGWVCDGGWTCTEYDNNKPTGKTCYYNGKDGCITGKGKEEVCIDSGKGRVCRTYIDGVYEEGIQKEKE